MSTRRVLSAGVIVAALTIVAGHEASGTLVTTLPPPPPPQFGWKMFGADLQVADITVTSYVKPDGSAGGQIIAFDQPVMDPDPDPAETSPEKIGDLHFQFVLWRGKDDHGDTGGGAALFGGFELTDTNDAGHNYSFLQLVTDEKGTRADFDQRFGFVNKDSPATIPVGTFRTPNTITWIFRSSATRMAPLRRASKPRLSAIPARPRMSQRISAGPSRRMAVAA
ncbi:MAG TPA: hypothetical protein VIZ17_22870 [Acetobacteraceae bacterium]